MIPTPRWFRLTLLGFLALPSAARPEPARAPGEEAAALAFTATSRVGFDDPENPELSGRVSLQESALSAPIAHAEFEGLTLAAGVVAGWTRLEFRGHPDLDTEDLYGLAAVLAAARPAESGWGWSALAMPGFYSDFRSGRTGEGKVFLYGTADYAFSPAWRAQLGLAFDTAFGDPAVYPVGGAVWQATDTLAVRLLLPSPSVYWAPSDRWGLFAFAQPAGDRWIVDDDDSGEQEFLIEAWRAGLGAECRLWRAAWLRLAAGLEFDRRYEARNGGQTLLDDRVDDAAFLSAALVIY
ncbi:MAG TPA: DUF6268 family outer membrane beta-barrel protein [Kiritimatiellia bacterium]|nr:DUF6268 family outer membrane beta-barrel protein [Kiritimatiellia bacterium]